MFKELIIVNNAGIGLFYQQFDRKIEDHQSIAALFSALKTYAQMTVGDELTCIVLGESTINIYNRDELNSIFRYNKNETTENRINLLAETIIDSFFNKYRNEITRFKGVIKCFDSFSDDLGEICQIKPKTTKKSSEILNDFLGLNKKIDYKKVLNSL